MQLRDLQPHDRSALDSLLKRIDNFRPDEIEIALELIDDAIAKGTDSDYKVIVAALDGAIVGYVCFGPTPMTAHAHDLYWIAVDPLIRNQGIGQKLYRATEDACRAQGGKILRLETSSQESYGTTVAFYHKIGFQLAARIPDFYHDNDDLLTFVRRFA